MSIDLFEMAFMENKKLSETDENKANTVKVVNEALNESKVNVKEGCKKDSEKDSKKKKITVDKLRFTENVDDIDIQPAEGIVVIYSDEIRPEMSKAEVDKAAEEMIGSKVCKCGICGANYIADAEDEHGCEECDTDEVLFVEESLVFAKEDLDVDEVEETENIVCDTTCPVCNSTEAQVEVGIIAPTEVEEEETEIEVDVEDTEEVEEKSETDIDEGIFDKFKKDKKDDTSEKDEKSDSKDEVKSKGIKSYKGINYEVMSDGTFRFIDDRGHRVNKVYKSEDTVKDIIDRQVRESAKHKDGEFVFRESALNHLLSKFVKENYDNIKDIKITHGMHINGELRLTGHVVTESGKRQIIAFNSVGFKLNEGVMKIKLREFGPFTESAVKDSKRVPFVLECICHNNTILPTALKYSFKVNQKDGIYECAGRNTLRDK